MLHRPVRLKIRSQIVSHRQATFQYLLQLDGLGSEEIQESLSVIKNRHRVFKAGEGAGSSGSFFFFSHDNRFLIKTMTSSEKKKMLNMLDDYVQHIESSLNRSLIARIYGIFEIKTNYFDTLHVMVMQNTNYMAKKSTQKLVFDLKGSLIDRRTNVVYRSSKKRDLNPFDRVGNSKIVMKDINFIELNQESELVRLSQDVNDEICF